MRKMFIGIGMLTVLLLLLTSAFAFSLTLQNLRVNALSFAQPASAAPIAAQMTSAAEAEIAAPASGGVRGGVRGGMRVEEYQEPKGFCQKNRTQDRATDF